MECCFSTVIVKPLFYYSFFSVSPPASRMRLIKLDDSDGYDDDRGRAFV